MQSQMIGMQSSLDRILSAVQPQAQAHALQQPAYAESSARRDSYLGLPSVVVLQPPLIHIAAPQRTGKSFPPLPGFAPPVSPSPLLRGCATKGTHIHM